MFEYLICLFDICIYVYVCVRARACALILHLYACILRLILEKSLYWTEKTTMLWKHVCLYIAFELS